MLVTAPAIQNELHALDATAEVRMEVASNRWVRDIVLLVRCVLGVADV